MIREPVRRIIVCGNTGSINNCFRLGFILKGIDLPASSVAAALLETKQTNGTTTANMIGWITPDYLPGHIWRPEAREDRALDLSCALDAMANLEIPASAAIIVVDSSQSRIVEPSIISAFKAVMSRGTSIQLFHERPKHENTRSPFTISRAAAARGRYVAFSDKNKPELVRQTQLFVQCFLNKQLLQT